jgi:hypothetical protein
MSCLLTSFLLKIGHFTLDGASNNDTMLTHLKNLLDERGIPTRFDPIDNRVRCYAHTIDLGCKAVVGNWPDDAEVEGYNHNQIRNPVALALEVVRTIRGSGLRREAFREVIDNGNKNKWFKKDGQVVQVRQLQLLRYVRTRWDSCFHMLNRLRELRPVSCYLGAISSSTTNFHTGGRLLLRAPATSRYCKVQDLGE